MDDNWYPHDLGNLEVDPGMEPFHWSQESISATWMILAGWVRCFCCWLWGRRATQIIGVSNSHSKNCWISGGYIYMQLNMMFNHPKNLGSPLCRRLYRIFGETNVHIYQQCWFSIQGCDPSTHMGHLEGTRRIIVQKAPPICQGIELHPEAVGFPVDSIAASGWFNGGQLRSDDHHPTTSCGVWGPSGWLLKLFPFRVDVGLGMAFCCRPTA